VNVNPKNFDLNEKGTREEKEADEPDLNIVRAPVC
jgi:hypothetical protein